MPAKPAISRQKLEEMQRKLSEYERKLMGDAEYFRTYPERFALEVIGERTMRRISKARKFRGFTEFQVAFIKDFINMDLPKLFLRCGRGGSKSFLIGYCCVLLCYIMDCEDIFYEISILGGSTKQANIPYTRYARAMIEDEHSMISKYCRIECTRDKIWFKESNSAISCLAAAGTSTRGPRGDLLVIDEVCSTDENIIEGYWGQMTTSMHFKAVVAGTPDDPSHISYLWDTDPKYGFKTHHWSSFDCLIENGGYMSRKTLEEMKLVYRSKSAQLRELYGEWASYGGAIIDAQLLKQATTLGKRPYYSTDLPPLNEMQYFIVGCDGARNSHFAAINVVGYRAPMSFVCHSEGHQDIQEPELRRHIMQLVEYYRRIGPTMLVIEDATISKTLNDNCEKECVPLGVPFVRSLFGPEGENQQSQFQTRVRFRKNNFIDYMCYIFENQKIKIPTDFHQIVHELTIYHWKRVAGKVEGTKQDRPAKTQDDFVDALLHALWQLQVVAAMLRVQNEEEEFHYEMTSESERVQEDRNYDGYVVYRGENYDLF